MTTRLRLLVPALSVVATVGTLHAAAPANDAYASRAELLTSSLVVASNVDATLDADEALPPGFTPENYSASVWWQWQPAMNGWYEISTQGSAIDTVLSVWASSTPDGPLSLVHVNNESVRGTPSCVQFQGDNRVYYKIAVASHGPSAAQGVIRLRAFPIPEPFAKVLAVRFEQTAVDVSSGATSAKAILSIEATRELLQGHFSVVSPGGVAVTTTPFSAANRVSGTVAAGEYEVSFTVPQLIEPGAYGWKLRVSNPTVGKVCSQGRTAFTPAESGSASTLAVSNSGPVDGYALWAAANGGSPLSDLLGNPSSLDGPLGLDKFAFGNGGPNGHAGASGSAPEIISVGSGASGKNHLRVAYRARRNSAAQGLHYVVQFSNDMQNWQPATQPPSTLGSDATFDNLAVDDSVATDEAPRRFARVIVQRTTP